MPYSTYIAASPSIWWNDREVLADEPVFAKRAKVGELKIRLLLTSAGDEQYRGDDPKLRAAADSSRMIDNVSELASRLTSLNPEKVVVTRAIFPDENHDSAALASLGRALTFALKP
jgi:predicted alpha/beta superfamily hydrolase